MAVTYAPGLIGAVLDVYKRQLLAQGLPADGFIFDTALAAYLVDATAGSYDLQRLFVTYYNGQLPQPDHLTADAFNPQMCIRDSHHAAEAAGPGEAGRRVRCL